MLAVLWAVTVRGEGGEAGGVFGIFVCPEYVVRFAAADPEVVHVREQVVGAEGLDEFGDGRACPCWNGGACFWS